VPNNLISFLTEKGIEMLTSQEVADMLRVNIETVRRWARNGDLPTVTLGTAIRFDMADIKKFIAKRKSK
jgi:excisionase family DNA binding protein